MSLSITGFPITSAELPIEKVRDLLTCAFEGGSTYWYRDLEVVTYPNGMSKDHFKHSEHTNLFWHIDVPIREGGKTRLVDEEGDKHILDLSAIAKGVQAFSKYPRHLKAALTDCDDAETGDVFLQCCVFGEIVYG